jgi:dipeptidyl-peptidase-4
MIIRPRDFDPKKTYPVLNFAYTGPGVNTVQPNGRAYLLHQWFADQGFIVVTIDGRGTPRRGRAWERAIKNDMISVALQDQCDGLLALCEKFPEMDRNRIGVYGWSYGGYFAAMAAMQRPDIFKAGVAGAPVADWRDYDTHYTERYLDMPLPADQLTDGIPGNQAGYDKSNVLTYCKDLQVPLLLIHGTADDNVYFTHSLKIADALTRANNPYEFMPLSGQTHMVTQPALVKAINTRMAEFFITHLGRPQ